MIKSLKMKLAELEKELKVLNLISKRLWLLENPPKYKYGDIIKIQNGDMMKILASTIKWQNPIVWDGDDPIRPGFYYWEYSVDLVGIGLKILTEHDIEILLKNK